MLGFRAPAQVDFFFSLRQNIKKLPRVVGHVWCNRRPLAGDGVHTHNLQRVGETKGSKDAHRWFFPPSVRAVRAAVFEQWCRSLTFWTCLSLVPVLTQTCLVLGHWWALTQLFPPSPASIQKCILFSANLIFLWAERKYFWWITV